ncbi:hypothetical protein PUV54_01130 [Hyphococcus flavus]|uniref:Uncharacterized protein n=1 Tax=Hyphococcus flavus TaxID=1866326 RepID=A0AAE9ZF81_9PROT|nr:hypothetical protein [Hyphococcus flavus]WDI31788.1 hypothetical protein PUV54_01130 [Hyphococcus flavus]
MLGNGITNIIAAAIIAVAIVFTGGLGGGKGSSGMTEEEFAAWYARAVGDIRNDIVVNCGCCGEAEGQRRAAADSF